LNLNMNMIQISANPKLRMRSGNFGKSRLNLIAKSNRFSLASHNWNRDCDCEFAQIREPQTKKQPSSKKQQPSSLSCLSLSPSLFSLARRQRRTLLRHSKHPHSPPEKKAEKKQKHFFLIVFDFAQREMADAYMRFPWYDANATRASADQVLGAAPKGRFIVRPSSKAGCLALSVKDQTVNRISEFFDTF
jgi:hypothetical protein